jgi:hypothetical protein
MDLDRYCDNLESRIDETVERDLTEQWKRFCRLDWHEPIFCPGRPAPIPPGIDWPHVPVNHTLDDFDRMALQQLGATSGLLANAGGDLLMVRCNYGTPIMATLFGCELFVMPESTDTLPAPHPVPGGAEAMRAILDRGEVDLGQPYLQKVFEMGRRFMDIKTRYPKIGRWVHLYHPDLQGPFDIFEMVFGSEIFMALMDEPDLVHQVLELITRAYLQVIEQWRQIAPLTIDEGLGLHWGLMHRGAVMLRDDSAMNLSPQMFDQFIRPYEQRVLDAVGGGAMHACGRVEHFVDRLPDMPGLSAFNMSQPQLNDIEQVYRHTLDRGIVLIGLDGAAARASLAAGRDLKGRVHTRA